MPLSLEDPTVTRRYYYSIKDISVGGRCICNGFSEECEADKDSKYRCKCQHNTQGDNCNQCKRGYQQFAWRPRGNGNPFECGRCNCHGHAFDCYFNEEVARRKASLDIYGRYNGGGVCRDCRHNTHGVNCEKCKPGYYLARGKRISDMDACQPCNCNRQFSTGLCAAETGQCECKSNYAGRYCNQCSKGYSPYPQCDRCPCDMSGSVWDGECNSDRNGYCRCKPGYVGKFCNKCTSGYHGFPDCKACRCLISFGAISNDCHQEDGQCQCRRGFSGRQCEKCSSGFYQFPFCKDCLCDPRTTSQEICEPGSGRCLCKPSHVGENCDQCSTGYYGYPACYDCGCSSAGSLSTICDVNNGRCRCKRNYDHDKCDTCAPGFYGYPTCVDCNCNRAGSRSSRCDLQSGQCSCKPMFTGKLCDVCLPGFYGFPNCQRCNCNPAGTLTDRVGRPGDCSTSNDGQCECKKFVQGLGCNECKPGYFELSEHHEHGCKDCKCSEVGTANGILSCRKEGQCGCKKNVMSTRCDQCADGFYNMTIQNIFGCQGCDCDVGGSVDQTCHKSTGECQCNPNIDGRKCNRPKAGYYAPSLHELKFEAEEGFTQDGDAVPFDYQEVKFPGYTWKGFVPMDKLVPRRSRRSLPQSVLVMDINIPEACPEKRSSSFKIMFRYVLNQMNSVTGIVLLYRSDAKPVDGVVNFMTTQKEDSFTSSYATIESRHSTSNFLSLQPGQWKLRIELSPSELSLDHVVFIPQEYAEATFLSKRVQKPCEVNTEDAFCNMYSYINLAKPGYKTIEAEQTGKYRTRKPIQLFNDTDVLSKLNFKTMILLSPEFNQQDILFSVSRPGKYVAVVQYYHDSIKRKLLNIYIRSRKDVAYGKAYLDSCRYSFGCRQVVIDSKDTLIFNMKSTGKYLLSMQSRTDTSVAVDSIILIPYEDWHKDLITPKHYCVTKDGKCVYNGYTKPADAKIFPTVNGNTGKQPSYLIDPDVKLKYLSSGRNYVAVTDVRAGRYNVIVHYYQPNHPSFEISSMIKGSGLYATLKLDYCPNVNGCRQKFTYGQNTFMFVNGNLTIAFDVPRERDAWVEYIIFIPEGSPSMKDSIFQTLPQELSADFVKRCTRDNFNIPLNDQFCQDSAFSLTTACNGGVKECGCHVNGSQSSQCDEFGGQCQCHPNMIGRTCTRCKIGYYGFPKCKACKCLNCDDKTGDCKCPPNVIGEHCKQCKPGFFGYDPIIGCQPCNCHGTGTGKSNAVCDMKDGQCPCLPRFGGRKCDTCENGYFSYPVCKKCDCLVDGSTSRICDVKSGKCLCQENVIGSRCTDTVPGYFKTNEPTPEKMALKCWCNGHVSDCEEAVLYRNILSGGLWNVSVNNVQIKQHDDSNGVTLSADISAYAKSATGKIETVYWVAPHNFLGNQVRSYGRPISFNFSYSLIDDAKVSTIDNEMDIIVIGHNMKITSKKTIIRKPNEMISYSTMFTEDNWNIADSGIPVTRYQLMLILSSINSIHIRASHDKNTARTTLLGFVMESANDKGTEQVYGHEQCNCNAGYGGLSCTLCAAGFYRQPDGTCHICDCSGKSNTCDPMTGKCTNCSENSMGDYCEKCKPGFVGDKCKRCECPTSDAANNFASSCSFSLITQKLICNCKPGYTGLSCEKCANNFFGSPLAKGSSCQKCNCNGRIKLGREDNCDSETGQCLKCIDNFDGANCQHCRPGYYLFIPGDTGPKKCLNCKCDHCGSTVTPCNRNTGQCQCKPNVDGIACDRCKVNHWGFNSCNGCQPCGCGAASKNAQCNFDSGKCECKANVIGKQCNSCQLGYFDYSSDCTKQCNCVGGAYCDVNTGNCDCGVNGESCTLCPIGFILENGKCVECDNCVQGKLKRVQNIENYVENITGVLPSTKNVNIFVPEEELERINSTLENFQLGPMKLFSDLLNEVKKLAGYEKYGKSPCVLRDWIHESSPDPNSVFKLVKLGTEYKLSFNYRTTANKNYFAIDPSGTRSPEEGLQIYFPANGSLIKANIPIKVNELYFVEFIQEKFGDVYQISIRANNSVFYTTVNKNPGTPRTVFWSEESDPLNAAEISNMALYNKGKNSPVAYRGKGSCWRQCNGAGHCPTFCGLNGYCCRKGFDCSAELQSVASSTDYSCVLSTLEVKPYRKENIKGCYYAGCTNGACPQICGENGFCCRKGFDSCSVAMQAVAPSTRHACIINPAPIPTCPAFQDIRATEVEFRNINNSLSSLEKEAYDTMRNVPMRRVYETKDKANQLEAEINEILRMTSEMVTVQGGNNPDRDESLELMEKRLQEIRNHSIFIDEAMAEKNNETFEADLARKLAEKLRKNSLDLENYVDRLKTVVASNLIPSFKNLRNHSGTQVKKGNVVKFLNDISKKIDIKSILDLADGINNRSQISLADANIINKAAKDTLELAIDLFKNFTDIHNPILAKLMDELRESVEGMKKGLSSDKDMMEHALEHAGHLKNQSIALQKVFQDTRKFASTSLTAAERYSEIAGAIYDAFDAATNAKEMADKSNMEAIAASKAMGASKAKSNELDKAVDKQKEEVDALPKPIDDLKLSLDSLKKLRQKIQNQLKSVTDDLKKLDTDTGEKAASLRSRVAGVAVSGKDLAEQTVVDVAADNTIVNKLRDGVAKANTDINDLASNKIEKAEKNVEAIENEISDLKKKTEALDEKIEDEVVLNLKYIRFLLDNSENILDDTKLAMKFNSTSKLELDPPKVAAEPLIGVQTSIAFKQKTPGDAMLFFMGNGDQPNDNGMIALDIKDNLVRFLFRNDNGETKILNSSKTLLPGDWYKATAERNQFKLTLSQYTIDRVIESTSMLPDTGGKPSRLTLGKDADVFVGSIPAGKQKPSLLVTTPFEGGLERLEFNDEVLGLWNWKKIGNTDGYKRSTRDKDAGEYSFFGDGFVELLPYPNSGLKKIELQFITLEENGLIFLGYEKDNDKVWFYSLEIHDGVLVSKFDFGSGFQEEIHSTAGKLNEGIPHLFQMRVRSRQANFNIDNKVIPFASLNDADRNYRAAVVNLGGIPFEAIYDKIFPSSYFSMTSGFVGSIKNVILSGESSKLDFVNNGLNFTRAFENQKGRSASFPSTDSYLVAPPCDLSVTPTSSKSLVFSFQTLSEDGVIFKSNQLLLQLVDGKVRLTVTYPSPNPPKMVETSAGGYNDGKWHGVGVTNKNGEEIILGVNGVYQSVTHASLLQLHGDSTSQVYFGGAPNLDGFKGNIKEPICGTREYDLPFNDAAAVNGALVGSLALRPPRPLDNSLAPPPAPPPPSPPSRTTTTTTVTTTTPKPTLAPCKITADESLVGAYGFGPPNDGYLVFDVNAKDFEGKSEYEFSFYTFERDGILLSVFMKGQFDYEAIWLLNGRLSYTFNAGSGRLLIQSKKKYNDGKWHKVVTTRVGREGTLTVDDVLLDTGTSPSDAAFVNNVKKVFVGGLPTGEIRPNVISNRIGSIRGGIGGIEINKVSVIPSEKKLVINAYGGGLEDGVQIGEKGGYAMRENLGSVNTNYDLSFAFRTKYRKGYLFYQRSTKANDGFEISIDLDGSLTAYCNNGDGVFSVTVKSANPSNTICDGEFHNVMMVKRGKTLTLNVDGDEKTLTSSYSATSAEIGNAPLFIGAPPADRRATSYSPFTGCIKDIRINNKDLDLGTSTSMVGEAMRGCGVTATKSFV